MCDIVGGRSASYEKELHTARQLAFKELEDEAEEVDADSIVWVDIDYEVVGKSGSMLMVRVSGMAVVTPWFRRDMPRLIERPTVIPAPLAHTRKIFWSS